ncbi:hypothetical protein [Polystyrenella longa]|uniref:hypothetical protein n=1 Tax=Polystyrenella longa TaxID=2528007 RepID=UPI00119CA717|nr:hypothetical protein [Polystyrenella longa]
MSQFNGWFLESSSVILCWDTENQRHFNATRGGHPFEQVTGALSIQAHFAHNQLFNLDAFLPAHFDRTLISVIEIGYPVGSFC